MAVRSLLCVLSFSCCCLLALPGALLAETLTIDPIPREKLLNYLAGYENFVLVDARSPAEYEEGHIHGAVNVPHDTDLAAIDTLPEDKADPLVVYCKSGRRAATLQARLEALGYSDVQVLNPGQMFWADELPVFNCGADLPEPVTLTTVEDRELSR